MKAMHVLTVTVTGLLVLALATPALADDKRAENYNKHMSRYYNHLREAEEEARVRDWDDYREEIEKAERELAKARQYASDGARGRDYDGRVEIRRGRDSRGSGFLGFGGRVEVRRSPVVHGTNCACCSRRPVRRVEPSHRPGRWGRGQSRYNRGRRTSGRIQFRFGSGGFSINLGGRGRRH